ncbi:MAG TPA: aminoglycoside phosphotransferase family protein [Caulobacteraceae bacterium]|jgi:aminoglycoside phosphotransferase (APT) family kinase protein
MSATPEPSADVEISLALARRLVAAQHPDLARLPLTEAESGWDNAMFRLDDDLAVRLPRRALGAALAETELRWLPVVAPGLPLPVPAPVRAGAPDGGYPYAWSIVPWLDGAPADLGWPGAAGQGAVLAAFLRALHQPAPADAPRNPYRGVALAERAAAFEERFAQSEAIAGPLPHLRRLWDVGVAAPIDTPRSWFHGDLHGRNVLTRDGRFTAIVDWGDMAAGDAACDLGAVWLLLPDRAERAAAMAAYDASQATWARARGWAAIMTVMLISIAGNERMPAMGRAVAARLRDEP